ncbi:hypothetical protein AMK59_5242 [Oryctes borbonicus]|uniref:C2H2-type domain-containing protein n=1 Tax=Oryctes borbonicus TaxID=1629725 RepID=A0A0T6B1R6_9SCAR|nr:hypothetical protein AMK59_5242 [Oryctes borbonicus]
MVNSESMDSTSDGNPKDYITQLNSGGGGTGISVDSHSPSPVTASSVRLRDMDYDANESAAADVTSASECVNPMDSLPETAVTHSVVLAADEENFRLTTNTVISQTDSEVSSLYCSVPLNKVQDVLGSYSSVDSPASNAETVSEAKNKKLLPRRLLCLYCDRTFVTSNLRQKHVDRCHSVKQARRSSSRFQSKFTTTACIFCKKLNNTDHSLHDLFKHLVEKHSNKYFACVACEERFVFKTHLEEHNLQNHEQEKTVDDKEEASSYNDTILSQNYPAEDSISEISTVKTKHKTRIKKDSDVDSEDLRTNRPNLRMSVRKELRKKKVGVKSTKTGVKRNTRLQTKVTNAQTKSATRKRTKTRNDKNSETNEKSSSTSINPYPTFDAFFRVKKITDHSIDNLKISSLTFDDVFDKAFYTRIKCNIQENLQNHIDGKLFKNEESESRISNFEKNQEPNSSPTENFGCDISLNAATPVVSLLSSQLGEDLESQIEYGAKASKKKPPPKKDEVHYKYFTRRKYQASILENKENRDLSKLDMWTQLVVKDRQQKIINDKKTEKEKLEYTKGIEYRTKMQNDELNRILDRRGPFEDLKEEANKKAALEKYNRLGENVSCEAISDVSCILNDLIEGVFDFKENLTKIEDDEKTAEQKRLQASDRDCEIPFYLNLRRNSSLLDQPDIDKSDRITLICSSQETENYEEFATPRDKNTLVELTGEWTRTRIYICAACGVKVPNMKYLLDHKGIYHQNVWVQHYEFVGNQSVLYKHLSIPGLGKVGFVEEFPMSKSWRRSDARLCTKCSKMCNTLGELHRHILECGEDWSWMLARKKLKYRPFGSKSRRKRRGLVKRIIHKEKVGDEVREKRKYNVKRYDGPRPKPSDAETIQRMLANLPAKRATRKLISLKDGFPKQVRRKSSHKQPNSPTNSAKNVVVSKQKASVSSLKNKPMTAGKRNKKGLKCNPMILRKSVRNINKVFGSKILDSNSALMVKRKIKNVLQHQRITRARKELIDEPSNEKKEETPISLTRKESLISKVKTLTKAVRKTVLRKDEKKNDTSDNSTSVNNSVSASKSTRNARSLKKADSLDDTIQDIINSIDTNDIVTNENKEVTKSKINGQPVKLDDNNGSKTEISKKKPKLMQKESVATKLVRTLSLRKLRKKNTEENKLKTQSNPELDVKNDDKSKNGKRKSTLDSFRNRIKKIKLKEKGITQIVQVDGCSQISDEILPFLEKINISSDENYDKTDLDNDQTPEVDPLGDIPDASTEIISNEEAKEIITNGEINENDLNDCNVKTDEIEILPIDTVDAQTNEAVEVNEINNKCSSNENSEENAQNIEIHSGNHLEFKSLSENHTDEITSNELNTALNTIDQDSSNPESKEIVKSVSPTDLKICSTTNKMKTKKRSKGLNDCIAMLTSKLQQKVDDEQPFVTDTITDASTTTTDTNTDSVSANSDSISKVSRTEVVEPCPLHVQKEPVLEEKEEDKIENNKQEPKFEMKNPYQFVQIPLIDYLTQQKILEMNRKIIDRDHIERQRQELFNLQARLIAEHHQLFFQQLHKQIPTNHPYGYIPNIPRENFLINNMLNSQNEFAQKLLHANPNDDDLMKLLGNCDKNNRFKEVDVNVGIDIMKYLGNVADNGMVKLEKPKNKTEGRRRSNNKTGTSRRYNNKRKENIEVIMDLKQQELLNKMINGRSVENGDLNAAFLETEEINQKKFDVLRNNDNVIDLKVKKAEDTLHSQPLKLPEGQIKNDSLLKAPKVIEVGQMRSFGFGIANDINGAIDLKVKKDAEKERQANLLEQLSKNGVSIALFPCFQNNYNKCQLPTVHNEVIDLKITKTVDVQKKTEVPNLLGGEIRGQDFILKKNNIVNNSHSNDKAIDLKINDNADSCPKILNILDEKKANITPLTIEKAIIQTDTSNKVLPRIFDGHLKGILPLHPIGTVQIPNAFVTNSIESKNIKKAEKKRRTSKSTKHKNEKLQILEMPLANTNIQSNEIINLKVSKSAEKKENEINLSNDFNLKPSIPPFSQIDLKLFDTLNTSLIHNGKTNLKTEQNQKIKDTLEIFPARNLTVLRTHMDEKKEQEPLKEKKKIILKPPQFIATSLEKFPVIENPVLPKVPTIAESLSFSIPENNTQTRTNGISKSVRKKNGAKAKNLDSIELKIKSLLLEEREPDIMEEKSVGKTCTSRSNSKNMESKAKEKDNLIESKQVDESDPQNSLPISAKSDTDSDDDIPLANLIKEHQKKEETKLDIVDNKAHVSDEETSFLSQSNANEIEVNKNSKEVEAALPVLETDISLPILEKEVSTPILENDVSMMHTDNDIPIPHLEKEIFPISLEANLPISFTEQNNIEQPTKNVITVPAVSEPLLPVTEDPGCTTGSSQPILENQTHVPSIVVETEHAMLIEQADAKGKKGRVRKRASPDEKKEKPRKKTPKCKGIPLYDESEIDPTNKAARKIRISCQIFQRSSKIVLERSILDEPQVEEEEEEEQRPVHQPLQPIIEALPDVIVKEEFSSDNIPIPPPMPQTELLTNIKEEIPETEEAEVSEAVPSQTEDFFPPALDATPSLSATDLELEIRRRIKLSNLQLKRENTDDNPVVLTPINPDIIYNVDSPQMLYNSEEVPNIGDACTLDMPYNSEVPVIDDTCIHGIDTLIEPPQLNPVDLITGTNISFSSELGIMLDAPNNSFSDVDSQYIDQEGNVPPIFVEKYQSGEIQETHCNVQIAEVAPTEATTCSIDNPAEGITLCNTVISPEVSSFGTENTEPVKALDPTENITEEASAPYPTEILTSIDCTRGNDSTIPTCLANIVAVHEEENMTEMNFDVGHEKEGDLPTETANIAPNIEVLEEQKPDTKDPEIKSKKTKKKHEISTTDIMPSYGEFQVNTNQSDGVNKITISRKKIPASTAISQIQTDDAQNNVGIDSYVVKKVKRSHRKSVSNKERKRKKSALLKENQTIQDNITEDERIFETNLLNTSCSFEDSFSNIEFEVQNEEIGRKLKINKKKAKTQTPVVTEMSVLSETSVVSGVEEVAAEIVAISNIQTEAIEESKSEEIIPDNNEEQKDYDNLPKDMEIEEFQVNIPIIETQFKPKFNIPISNIDVNQTFSELPIQLATIPEEHRSEDQQFPNVSDESLTLPLVTGQFDVSAAEGDINSLINLENANKSLDTDLNRTSIDVINFQVEDVTFEPKEANIDPLFDDCNIKELYDTNLNQQKLNMERSNSSCEPFLSADTNVNSFHQSVSPVSLNKSFHSISSSSTKKCKRSKNAVKVKLDISKTGIGFDGVVEQPKDPENTKNCSVAESSIPYTGFEGNNNEIESQSNEFDFNLQTNVSELPITNIANNAPQEIVDKVPTDFVNVLEIKKPKTFAKKAKNFKNSKNTNAKFEFIEDPAIQSDTPIQTEIINIPTLTSPPEIKSACKKSKKSRNSKTAQKSEPSTFDMMCEELQALCDTPLEPLNENQSKSKENPKELPVDDDLYFLNASPNSFCDNLRSSCDAKIDELLREINFAPRPSKRSKKSKRSTSKNKDKSSTVTPDVKESVMEIDKNLLEAESEFVKSCEDVNLEKSDIVESVKCPTDANQLQEDDVQQMEQSSEVTADDDPVENSVPNILSASSMKSKSSKSKSSKKKAAKTKKERSISVDNAELYCDICDKMFARSENLVKHKRTLTHIAKLSEIEAKEAQAKAQQIEEIADPPLSEQQESYKMDINISDILNNSEKQCDQADLNNEITNKILTNSPFVLKTNSDTLKLADIINDVLNKPVDNEKHSSYTDSNLSQTPHSITKGETKRYKSLGERKSFESDLKTTYPFNTMPVASDAIPKLPNTDPILKQQITILENIIGNEGPFGFIDDISVSSNKSIEEPLTKSPSNLSMMSETKQDDSNQLTFTHNADIINTLAKPNIHNEPFIKPTQYEEISNDSSSVRNQFDDQRSRKVLNRDEELFLECCSLLKSSSEVSGYSKRSSKTVHVFNNFEMKQSDEPDWLEKKNFSSKNQEYKHDIFANSCPNTPLGDGYGDDYSNTNSNTIATDWSTKQREQQENPVFEDISLDSKGSTTSKQENGQFKTAQPTFANFQLFTTEHPKMSEAAGKADVNGMPPPIDGNNIDGKGADEDFKKKMVSRFGGLMAKAWKNSVQAVKKNKNKKKQDTEVTQTSITDYAVPLSTPSSTPKLDNDLNDSKKMLTKGAMKVFEGLKVSIPTDDLDMKELLNGSNTAKKQEEEPAAQPVVEVLTKELEASKEDTKTPKTNNNMRSFGNRLGLKVTKKKYTLTKPKDLSAVPKHAKTEDAAKKGHDVYDFEETQDCSDMFSTKLTNIKEFRNQIAEQKSLSESNVNKEPSPTQEIEESDSDSRKGAIDSFSFEAQSLSSFSTESSSSVKKPPKKKNITKNKCMIMGRIFKNAFKSKIDEDIRDIPSVDNSKLVEDYVMHLPAKEEKRSKLTEQEMDMLFDKLLEDKPTNEKDDKKKPNSPPTVSNNKPIEKPVQISKAKTKNQPKRKRQRHNSESTDDEFSLNKNKKRYTKKKQKNVDNAINLEQELKECIGVASRKSQRKCTSGKQNVLVEFWSSDDSNFEAFIRETAMDKPITAEPPKVVQEEPQLAEEVQKRVNIDNDQLEPNVEELFKDLENTIKKATPKIEGEHQQKIEDKPISGPIHKPGKINLKQARRKSSNVKHRSRNDDDVEDKKMKNIKVTAETLAANRRKRAASNTLYYWSSSSEDESQDLIEVKPVRDEVDEDEDRPMQHGWIVGDSPKKLVTMLAQAKGKKIDADCVKEQGKKRTTM